MLLRNYCCFIITLNWTGKNWCKSKNIVHLKEVYADKYGSILNQHFFSFITITDEKHCVKPI